MAELRCTFAAIVYAELYELIVRSRSDAVYDLLDELGMDQETVRRLIDTYRLAWECTDRVVLESKGALSSSDLVTSTDHAQLAQFVLSTVRENQDTIGMQSDLLYRVRLAFEATQGFCGIIPECAQPVVAAWGLGMRVGQMNPVYPAVLAVGHGNRNVDIAYTGLVEHLVVSRQTYGLPIDDWPELVRSAVIWRAVAILDGLGKLEPHAMPTGQGNRGGAADAAAHLTGAVGSYLPVAQRTRYGRAWGSMVAVRDGLTHITEGTGSNPRDFSAAAAESSNWSDLGDLLVEGLTALMLFLEADAAAQVHPNEIRVTFDRVEASLEWVRQAFS